jgi:AcrR family transcriptional regulator
MARTRKALVNAGTELFANQGFDATTTEDVAARAGVPPSTLLRYFPTKEWPLFVGEYDYTEILARRDLAAVILQHVVLLNSSVTCRRRSARAGPGD